MTPIAVTTVTIDRKDIEEARRACAEMEVEVYFMEKTDDKDTQLMAMMTQEPFLLWYTARRMQLHIDAKSFTI